MTALFLRFGRRLSRLHGAVVRTRRYELVVGLVALVTACGGGSAATAPDAIAADYTLARIDGAAVPYRVDAAPDRLIEIASGRLSLTPEGTYDGEIVTRSLVNGVSSESRMESRGQYRYTNATVVLTDASGTSRVFSVSSDGRELSGAGLPGSSANVDILRTHRFQQLPTLE